MTSFFYQYQNDNHETVLPKIDSDQFFYQYQNDNHISNHASSTLDHDQSDTSSQVSQSKVITARSGRVVVKPKRLVEE